ncbi:MAG: molybdopterin molybdenumtransferase MoeA [Gammaproteobacteria bacterium]|nr:molybdopterin molybdenumtransferase MoeA [Gammaproteobacteria bacterium]
MNEGTARESSCLDDYDPQALSTEEALARILESTVAVGVVERVTVRAALGRILATDVRSGIDVPAHTNSAMDGYAVRSDDLGPGKTLRLAGTSLAGRPHAGGMGPGECVRIMTGAVMPAGADTVVPQEFTRREDDLVQIVDGRFAHGDNVRAAGEDIAAGQVALDAGRRIQPADLGLLASLGVVEVAVYRRLRVAFLSTGDELRSLGETLGPGDVYDSNRYTLYGMLVALGVDVVDMGVVRDVPEDLREAFAKAGECADVVISSGGVSVGEADFVKETLGAVGRIQFWRVAMKPGRPLAYGRIGPAVFFGLPGNPVSVMVTFYQFVQPALRRMMGETHWLPLSVRAVSATRLKKRPGRVEYQRGVLERAPDGTLMVRRTGAQGSGILRSMSDGNCFIVLPMDSGDVEPGTPVDVQPFHGLLG